MKNRIDHLEDLVKRLIAERKNGLAENTPHTPESSIPDDNKALQGAQSHASEVACAGTTMIDGTRSVYRGGDEWYDVLEEVSILICLSIFAVDYFASPMLVHSLFDLSYITSPLYHVSEQQPLL